MGRIKPSRLHGIRTSIKYYVQALGCPNVKDCSEDIYAMGKMELNRLLDDTFKKSKSPYVLRNMKNNIGFLLRQGEELNLIQIPERENIELDEKVLGHRKIGLYLPPIASADRLAFYREHYGLPLEKWPDVLKTEYEEWKKWVSKENIIISGISPYNRPTTIENKTKKFEAFFGYLYNVREIQELEFQMLIDVGPEGLAGDNKNYISLRKEKNVGLLEEYAYWHIERSDKELSTQVLEVCSIAISVAEKYFYLKALSENKQNEADILGLIAAEIGTFRNSLKERFQQVKPAIAKAQRIVTAEDLWLVAQNEFPVTTQIRKNQSGAQNASNAGRALAIMLLLHYPLRNKNYREATLSQNLVKNEHGQWILRFTGDAEEASLKSKMRLNQPNIYEVTLIPEIVKYLEQYLEHWHPKLTHKIDHRIKQITSKHSEHTKIEIQKLEHLKDYIFLNSNGNPFNREGFSLWIQGATYRWLGVRVNPDLIRQIAAKELLRKTGNIDKVAELLNAVPESITRLKNK